MEHYLEMKHLLAFSLNVLNEEHLRIELSEKWKTQKENSFVSCWEIEKPSISCGGHESKPILSFLNHKMEETTQVEAIDEQQVPALAEEEGKKVYTQEEVDEIRKKLQSDTDKGVQKLIKEKKDAEKLWEAIGKVGQNESYLVEVYENSPEIAKLILDKYYEWKTIDAFKADIGYSIDYNDPATRQKYFEIEARRMAEKSLINASKSSFIAKLNMSDVEKEAFEEAFSERMQLKSFNTSDIEKHLEKAYREISDNTEETKKLKTETFIAKTLATSQVDAWGVTTKKSSGLEEEIKALLKNL